MSCKLPYHVYASKVTLLHPESRKSQILARVFGWLNQQTGRNSRGYPQGWYRMPRNRFLRTLCKRICGILGGHEISKTEWGYGGGEYADRNCRWCDVLIRVPKDGNVWGATPAAVPDEIVDGIEKGGKE